MSIFKKFPRTFWVGNIVEMFERAAWYGLFMVLAIYLTSSQETGALGFSQAQKGLLMGVITGMVYFLPVFTGAISDKIGFKLSMLIAFVMYFIGFLLMAKVHTYSAVFISFAIVGLGAAFFKPLVSATVAKTTNESNSSIGFGIFYMMVNIGGFVGPIIASKAREVSWHLVFYISAATIALNFLIVLLAYKEPEREITKESFFKSTNKILKNIVLVFKDWKFLVFLIIIIGFWTMYMQFYFSMPVFLEQWIDRTKLFDFINHISPFLATKVIGTPQGTVEPEMILNTDALYIIFFQILISTFVMRFKALNAMIGGIFVAAIGIGLVFLQHNVFFILPAILVFSVGEMSSSPKITEYIGLIAPKDKKALYMGMSFLPLSGGNFLAGWISGGIFARISDKVELLKHDFIAHGWTVPQINDKFTQQDFFNLAAQKLQMTQAQLTQHLWTTYHPYSIWVVFTALGTGTAILLFLYDRFILKTKKGVVEAKS